MYIYIYIYNTLYLICILHIRLVHQPMHLFSGTVHTHWFGQELCKAKCWASPAKKLPPEFNHI